ncbi:uncharacterized protein LOC142546188 isoform X1 [Primulina tabacum]|uniref:uncharacterized protein LOC142546188 isoform X1 n=1 Tax=Primulina tabacum TaxID=48773 RepID=UPI003F5A33BA
MSVTSKRKSDQPTLASLKIARVGSVGSASSKAVRKMPKCINTLFVKYSNKFSGLIDPEGIEKLCSDLKVDHTDVRVLMFAWKLKAEMQGYFTLDEWQSGLMALQVNSFNKLKKALPQLEKEVLMPENFEDFYIFAFRYHLTDEKQKFLDMETICILLDLILKSQYQLQVTYFIEFLKIQKDYKTMNMDQWIGLYRFCKEISFPDLQNYDSGDAWPLILDNFVEWLRESGFHAIPLQDL